MLLTLNVKQIKGFTLIELSIVLVIIGFIVGGVLVGQDLINAAAIHSSLTQLEKFKTASFTFQDKYGGIPGDLAAAKALSFGLNSGDGSIGRGDSNGLLENGSNNLINLAGETYGFWEHLSYAKLINYTQNPTFSLFFWGASDGTSIGTNRNNSRYLFPPGNLNNTYWLVYSNNLVNYYLLTGPISGTITPPGFTNVITPQQGFQIDKKIDDGQALTGNVIAITGVSGLDSVAVAVAPAAGVCVSNVTNNYNLNLGNANTAACQIRIRF